MTDVPTFKDLFNDATFHKDLFDEEDIFLPLKRLAEYMRSITGGSNVILGTVHQSSILVGDGIIIESGAYVDAHTLIQGPVLISRNSFVGHSALIRSNTIIGEECVVGHSSEIKNSVIFPKSSAAHFNFIGDTIIGSYVNLGGGTIISNFEFPGENGNRSPVHIRVGSKRVNTGLDKFGAIIGDNVSTGANSVLSPGTILGRGTSVYPSACVRKGITKPNAKITQEFYR